MKMNFKAYSRGYNACLFTAAAWARFLAALFLHAFFLGSWLLCILIHNFTSQLLAGGKLFIILPYD